MVAILQVLSVVAMFAVALIVVAGLVVMVRSKPGDPARGNKLMRLRVGGQAVAIVLLGLLWLSAYLQG